MRGSMLDLLVTPILISLVFTTGLLYIYVNRQVTSRLQTQTINAGADATDINYIYAGNTRAVSVFEKGIFIVIFLSFIGSVILSFGVKTNPVFATASIFVYGFGIVVMAIAKGIVTKFYTAFPTFQTTISWGTTFWNNSILIATIFGGINFAVIYFNGGFE